jgi:UPF0755 protein
VRDEHAEADEPVAPSLFDGDLEDHPYDDEHPADSGPAPVRRRRGGMLSCLVVLVVLAVLLGGGALLVFAGIDKVKDVFAGPEDYSGSGSGSLVFQVQEGDSSAAIARNLKSAGVVKSVEAFTDAAAEDSRSRGIQVGYYELRKKMSAEAALKVLVDPANLVQSSVTIPEGLRVEDTVKLLSQKTDIPVAAFEKALEDPDGIGLPSYAKGNAEGYLFPATYAFPPKTNAADVLASMVDRWQQAADDADLEGNAAKLGYSPGELMTVASLVESEANRDEDRGKVARVIYNRLETDATNHLLQIDATVNYALGRDLGLGLTTEDLDVDSPSNTRKFAGLPPGPIESPGDKAIQAATHPTEGDWVYYVTVNLDTGETKFAQSYDQFLTYKRELEQWCAGSDRC